MRSGRGVDFAVDEFETVHDFRFAPPLGQPGAERKPALPRRPQRHALFQRARDEEDVPHVRVKVAHEFLNALARRAVAVTEIVRHGRLQVLAQHVERTVDVVMQFRPRAQQKIIGRLQLPALGFADKFLLLQFAQRARAVFEKRHPQQVLEIAQAAAAVFDVRLLHAGRVAELGAPRRLVFQPHRNVFVLETGDAFVDERFLEPGEQRLLADDEPRFDERRFRLHVRVRHIHAIVNAPHRVSDLQADVPQRIQHAVNQPGQIRQRFARRNLAVVQKHEVNVAVRVQLAAAVTANRHQRQRRKFLLRPRRQAALGRFPEMPQQRVEHRRAALANLTPASARTVQQFEPVRLHLEKTLVARELFRRVGVQRQRQMLLGVSFDFFEQILHRRTRCGQNELNASRRRNELFWSWS